jgi:hypothetical protein
MREKRLAQSLQFQCLRGQTPKNFFSGVEAAQTFR